MMGTRILTCAQGVALLALLAAPTLALAVRYQPDPKFLEGVRAPKAFLPYRLGIVEFKEGTSDAWLEYTGDLRSTLRAANYFEQTDAPRLRLEIQRSSTQGKSNGDGCMETPGALALTYRFLDGEREVNRLSITTVAPVSGDGNDWDAAMSVNLKFLLLEMRKGQGDPQFAAQAGGLEARIREGIGQGSNTGCTVGAVLARGFVATVEGAVAVAGGLGEVAGTALEVAASPQFQSTMNSALAEQREQQARQQAASNAQWQAQQRAQAETARRQPEVRQVAANPTREPQRGTDAPPAVRPVATPAVATAPAARPPVASTPSPTPASRQVVAAAAPTPPAVAAAVKPLRFVLSISMRNLPGDTVNPSCYSNIITRPAPPGWGAGGFLPSGSGERARETVFSLKAAFIAKCQSASGRQVTSEGNFNYHDNRSADDEQRLQNMRARYREDVSVTM
jgi:hypothetical protein